MKGKEYIPPGYIHELRIAILTIDYYGAIFDWSNVITNTIVMGSGITATESDTVYINDNSTIEEEIRAYKMVIDKFDINSTPNSMAIYTLKLIALLKQKIKRDYCS